MLRLSGLQRGDRRRSACSTRVEFDQGRRRLMACIAARWQAARWPPDRRSSSGRSCAAARRWRAAQRGWKAQPGGNSRSEGVTPGMPPSPPRSSQAAARCRSARGVGMARTRSAPRGWCRSRPAGRRTSPPAVSTNCAISPMSWPIRISAALSPLLLAAERLHHLALGDHVERAGRLVGDDHLRARAACRWRCRRAASCRRDSSCG